MPVDPPFYAPDLAATHHESFGHFARAAAPVVVGELRSRGFRRGLVVDLGCGSGILAREMTDAGYDVLGVDISRDMVRLARRHAPKATFSVGSLLDVELPECAAVTAVGECFNYAFDSRAGLVQVGGLFRRINTALEPDGFLLFDVAGRGRGGPGGLTEVFHDRDDWSLHFVARERGRTLTREMTLFRKVGKTYRRSDERHVLRLYEPAEISGRLRAAAFDVRRLYGYGDLRFPPGLSGFLASAA